MKHKHIEASREARLWIGQVIIPTVTCAATLMHIPGVKESIAQKVENVKKSRRNRKTKRAIEKRMKEEL